MVQVKIAECQTRYSLSAVLGFRLMDPGGQAVVVDSLLAADAQDQESLIFLVDLVDDAPPAR